MVGIQTRSPTRYNALHTPFRLPALIRFDTLAPPFQPIETTLSLWGSHNTQAPQRRVEEADPAAPSSQTLARPSLRLSTQARVSTRAWALSRYHALTNLPSLLHNSPQPYPDTHSYTLSLLTPAAPAPSIPHRTEHACRRQRQALRIRYAKSVIRGRLRPPGPTPRSVDCPPLCVSAPASNAHTLARTPHTPPHTHTRPLENMCVMGGEHYASYFFFHFLSVVSRLPFSRLSFCSRFLPSSPLLSANSPSKQWQQRGALNPKP